MPKYRLRVHHTAVLGLLLHSAFGMQGCLAITWLGAVGIHMTRTSDIEFRSFENSWAVAPQERHHLGLVKSIAVMPFVGDPAMAEQWIAVLQHMTDLRVVSLSGATRQGHLNVNLKFSPRSADLGQIGLAKRISTEFQVGLRAVGECGRSRGADESCGITGEFPAEALLHLISAEGSLLWKTELPYMIVKGAIDLDEEMVTHALLIHVLAQANEVGLAELGAGHRQAASRFLRDRSDHQQTQLSPAVERP